MAFPKSSNPFADDDEEEGACGSNVGGIDENDRGLSDAERRQRHLQQEVMRTAKSAVDSSHRSLGLIYDSEKMGVDTAEELMRQGEVLKRSEKMVDNMEEDLKTSQRHINGIKSVWGGLVNYFKAKPETKPPPVQNNSYQASDKLQNALSSSRGHEDKYQASHPNLRKIDTAGFGASAPVDDDPSVQNGHPRNQHLRAAHQTLDNNLADEDEEKRHIIPQDDMCLGLSRLKGLGLGLQSELESQDDSLDSLMNKVDKMDLKINNTNQQIKNLK